MQVEIKADERLDDLELKGLKIIQDPSKFCFGIDAVLLSAFAKVKPGEDVVDIGTGTGIIPLLLSAKTDAKYIKAVEIQPDMVDMAKRSVLYNNLQDRIEIICNDIKRSDSFIKKSSVDVVVSNPPYIKSSHAITNPKDSLRLARHEIACTLEDILSAASNMLKYHGRFYMIHKAHRLTEIVCKMREYKLELKRLRSIHPFADKPAKMVLIEGVKQANPWLDIDPPLIIYKNDGEYTEEIIKIYGK